MDPTKSLTRNHWHRLGRKTYHLFHSKPPNQLKQLEVGKGGTEEKIQMLQGEKERDESDSFYLNIRIIGHLCG